MHSDKPETHRDAHRSTAIRKDAQKYTKMHSEPQKSAEMHTDPQKCEDTQICYSIKTHMHVYL